MSTIICFDTSALAKWYINEAKSEDVEQYIREQGPVSINDLTVVETNSARNSFQTLGPLNHLSF